MIAETRVDKTIIIDGVPLPDMLDEDMVRSVVHGFYDAIRNDDLLGPVFANQIADDAWPLHLAKMCDFWSATLLRTDRYEGALCRRILPFPASMNGISAAGCNCSASPCA